MAVLDWRGVMGSGAAQLLLLALGSAALAPLPPGQADTSHGDCLSDACVPPRLLHVFNVQARAVTTTRQDRWLLSAKDPRVCPRNAALDRGPVPTASVKMSDRSDAPGTTVCALVGADGSVARLRDAAGRPSGDSTFRAAVRTMRFTPAMRGGRPVPAWVEVQAHDGRSEA